MYPPELKTEDFRLIKVVKQCFKISIHWTWYQNFITGQNWLFLLGKFFV